MGCLLSVPNSLVHILLQMVFIFTFTTNLLIKLREEQISTNDTITSTISPIIFQFLLDSHIENSTI